MSAWIPEFKGQRPPFMPGNQLSLGNRGPLLHGAYSLRRVETLARRLVKEARETDGLDYLTAGRFKAALWDWARAEARHQLVEAWVAGMTPDEAADTSKTKTSPLALLLELGVRAGNHGDRLGLSPAAAKEMADEIRQARETLRRKAERKALHDDQVEAAREAWFPDD